MSDPAIGPSIEDGIVAWVRACPAMAALEGRFYARDFDPKGSAYPVGNCFSVEGSGKPTLNARGPQEERMQFEFWAKGSRSAARYLADALAKEFDQFTGALGNGFYVTSVQWLGIRKLPPYPDAGVSGVGCEFNFRYNA